LLVYRTWQPPNAPLLERGRRPAPPDPVSVRAGSRVAAGVEIGNRLGGGENREIVGQGGVERLRGVLGRRPALDLDARHLAESVDARVGATGDRQVLEPRVESADCL